MASVRCLTPYVPIVEKRRKFLFSQAETDRCIAVTASARTDLHDVKAEEALAEEPCAKCMTLSAPIAAKTHRCRSAQEATGPYTAATALQSIARKYR